MQWIKVAYAGLMICSSLCSVCGNTVLLLLLLSDRNLQTETWTLTLSFSLSDLALGLSTIPFGAHNSLFQPQGYASSSALCQGSAFLFLLLQLASVHSLTWATIDKFTEICFPLKYPRIFNARRTRAILTIIWIYSLLNASLPLLGFGNYSYSSSRFLCAPSFEPANTGFNMFFIVVGIITPILAMCCLYGYIVYIAWNQVRRGTFVCNEHHCFYVPANNYFKSSIVMVTTTVCLLICWLPYITICFHETLTGSESPQPASAIATWLMLFTSTLNPWTSSMSQTRYRVALHRSVNRIRRCGQKNSISRSTEMRRESHNCPSSVSSAPQVLQKAHTDHANEPKGS